MNQIKCKIEGCTTTFTTAEAVSKDAQFICKNHDKESQTLAARKKFIPYDPENPNNNVTDESDALIHFQNHQFDKDIRRGGQYAPEGTEHILNQGEREYDSDSDPDDTSSPRYGQLRSNGSEEEDRLIDQIDSRENAKQ